MANTARLLLYELGGSLQAPSLLTMLLGAAVFVTTDFREKPVHGTHGTRGTHGTQPAAAAGRPRRWEHALKDELKNFAQNPSLRAQKRALVQHAQKTRSKDSLRPKHPAKGAGSRQGSGKSQGGQEARLHQIFATVGVLNKSYVEFGYQGRSTSNTFALWKDGWNGLLLNGDPRWALGLKSDGGEPNLHRAKVTSRSIVRLFRQYDVPLEVDYVSIDIDSFDLWVLRALLGSEYRPRVLTVEYNSNFPWDAGQLAFPDPEVMRVPRRLQQWAGNCYMGSSAAALHAVAREHRYSVVDIEPGLDLFLVRDDLWVGRPLPDLASHRGLYRPFNVQRDGAMKPDEQAHPTLGFSAKLNSNLNPNPNLTRILNAALNLDILIPNTLNRAQPRPQLWPSSGAVPRVCRVHSQWRQRDCGAGRRRRGDAADGGAGQPLRGRPQAALPPPEV